MQCPECKFEIDEVNESQPVCPRCGTSPYEANSPLDHPLVQDALADLPDISRWEREQQLYEKPGNALIN